MNRLSDSVIRTESIRLRKHFVNYTNQSEISVNVNDIYFILLHFINTSHT